MFEVTLNVLLLVLHFILNYEKVLNRTNGQHTTIVYFNKIGMKQDEIPNNCKSA